MLYQFQQGKNLVEMLIAIVVVSIGVLGIASLQIGGTRSTMETQFRSVATIYAREIIERVDYNHENVTSYELEVGTEVSAPENCGANELCIESSLATYDLYSWLDVIQNSLPLGKGSIDCTDSSPVYSCTVSVYWRMPNPEAMAENASCNVPEDVAGEDTYDCVSVPFRINTARS